MKRLAVLLFALAAFGAARAQYTPLRIAVVHQANDPSPLTCVYGSSPAVWVTATGCSWYCDSSNLYVAAPCGGEGTAAVGVNGDVQLFVDGILGTVTGLNANLSTGVLSAVGFVGPITGNASTATTLSSDLPYSLLAQGQPLSVLGVSGGSIADNASIIAVTDGVVMRRSGATVAFGAVNLASANAVTGLLPDANIDGALARDAEVAAAYQLTDADLTAIAALSCADGMPLEKSSGVWVCGTDDTLGGGAVTGSGITDRVPLWSGTSTLDSDTGLTFNRTTDVVTAGGFAGPLVGAVTGNVIGNLTGTASNVTTNANLTGPITSVGNATTVADNELAVIAGLTAQADRVPYFTGGATGALATLTSAGRSLIDDTDATAQRSTLGLGTLATLNALGALTQYGDLCGALEGVRRNAGDTLNECFIPSSGDVLGPAVSVDNTIPRFVGTTGKSIESTGVSIDDSNGILSPQHATDGGYVTLWEGLDNGASTVMFKVPDSGLDQSATWTFNAADGTLPLNSIGGSTGARCVRTGSDGRLTIAGGDCNASPLTTKGDVYTRSSSADARLPVGVDAQILGANSANSTGLGWYDTLAVIVTGEARGNIIRRGSSGWENLALGTSGYVLTSNGTDALWAAAPVSTTLTTKGDLQGFSTVNARVPVGANGSVLTADSTDAEGVAWTPGVLVSETSPAAGHILVHDGTDSYDNRAVGGDATMSSTGAVTLASTISRDTEWDTAAEINAATTDADLLTTDGTAQTLLAAKTITEASGALLTLKPTDTGNTAAVLQGHSSTGVLRWKLYGNDTSAAGGRIQSWYASDGTTERNFIRSTGIANFYDGVTTGVPVINGGSSAVSSSAAWTITGGLTLNTAAGTFNAGAVFNTTAPDFNVSPTLDAGYTLGASTTSTGVGTSTTRSGSSNYQVTPSATFPGQVTATAPAWAATTAYTAYASFVTNDTGKQYKCITSGTSAGSGGPTGTTEDITDNTVHWKYIGVAHTAAAKYNEWTYSPFTAGADGNGDGTDDPEFMSMRGYNFSQGGGTGGRDDTTEYALFSQETWGWTEGTFKERQGEWFTTHVTPGGTLWHPMGWNYNKIGTENPTADLTVRTNPTTVGLALQSGQIGLHCAPSSGEAVQVCDDAIIVLKGSTIGKLIYDGTTLADGNYISVEPVTNPTGARLVKLPNISGTVVVSALSATSGPAAWAANGVNCATACTTIGQANCAAQTPLDGTNTRTTDCTTPTTGTRVCECY